MELMKAVRLLLGARKTAKPRSIRRDGGEERDFLFLFFVLLESPAHCVFLWGISLALLISPLPTAQPFTERNLNKDFNTLGVGGGNKVPQGVWSDGTTISCLSDVKWENLFLRFGLQRTSG